MNTDGPITFTGLIKFLQYIKGPDRWHSVGDTGEPAFDDSWANYGGTQQDARFIKDASGVVHIQGVVKDGSLGDYTVFTLPVGYRPTGEHLILPTIANGAIGRMDIHTDGRVVPVAGNNTYFSIHTSFYVG